MHDCRRCRLSLIFLMPTGVWSSSVRECVSIRPSLYISLSLLPQGSKKKKKLFLLVSLYIGHWFITSSFSMSVWWSVNRQYPLSCLIQCKSHIYLCQGSYLCYVGFRLKKNIFTDFSDILCKAKQCFFLLTYWTLAKFILVSLNNIQCVFWWRDPNQNAA